MITRWRRSPPTAFGHSEIAAPSSIRETPLPISGAVIVAFTDVNDPKSWCKECCIGRWSYETSDFEPIQLGTLTVPVYCFYFTQDVDMKMFSNAYTLNMKLALEVLQA